MHSVGYENCDDIIDIDALWYHLKVLPFKCATGFMGQDKDWRKPTVTDL